MTPEDTSQASPPEAAKPSPVKQGSLLDKLKSFVKKNPMQAGAIALGVIIVAAVGLTDLKYPIIGTFYKSTVELSVIDPEINEPITEANVQINGAAGTTDKDGKITLNSVSPGNQTVTVSKEAYQTYSEKKKIKFGRNNLGTVELKITGVRVSFALTNKISGAKLSDVKITIGEASAITDSDGKATVSV